MADAFKCDVCSEMKEGSPEGEFEVGPEGFDIHKTYHICEDCTEDIIQEYGL